MVDQANHNKSDIIQLKSELFGCLMINKILPMIDIQQLDDKSHNKDKQNLNETEEKGIIESNSDRSINQVKDEYKESNIVKEDRKSVV